LHCGIVDGEGKVMKVNKEPHRRFSVLIFQH
jgi:hypothetical protein